MKPNPKIILLLRNLDLRIYVSVENLSKKMPSWKEKKIRYWLTQGVAYGFIAKMNIPQKLLGGPHHNYKLLPEGKLYLDEHCGERFHGAVKAVLIHDDLVLLLIRDEQDSFKPGEYDLPGGGILFGESSKEALLREIEEETTLKAEIVCPVRTWYTIKGEKTQYIGTTFLALAESNKIELSEEHSDFKWIDIEIIDEYEFSEWLKNDLDAGINAYNNQILQK